MSLYFLVDQDFKVYFPRGRFQQHDHPSPDYYYYNPPRQNSSFVGDIPRYPSIHKFLSNDNTTKYNSDVNKPNHEETDNWKHSNPPIQNYNKNSTTNYNYVSPSDDELNLGETDNRTYNLPMQNNSNTIKYSNQRNQDATGNRRTHYPILNHNKDNNMTYYNGYNKNDDKQNRRETFIGRTHYPLIQNNNSMTHYNNQPNHGDKSNRRTHYPILDDNKSSNMTNYNSHNNNDDKQSRAETFIGRTHFTPLQSNIIKYNSYDGKLSHGDTGNGKTGYTPIQNYFQPHGHIAMVGYALDEQPSTAGHIGKKEVVEMGIDERADGYIRRQRKMFEELGDFKN